MASIYKRNGKGSWIIAWFDHAGRRREKSSRTTDKRTAERIAAKLEGDVALRRDGVVDARTDNYAQQNRIPLADHVAAYLMHGEHAGQSKRHLHMKRQHLSDLAQHTGSTRLNDVEANGVQSYLHYRRHDLGRSARHVNQIRADAVAFCNWCVKTGRLADNPLCVIPKMDERRDRRRVRCPLTDEMMARLLAVAEPRRRRAWYMAAAMAGLRKGDLQGLTWADVDFEANTITIGGGKSNREDVIPMHPQLTAELKRQRNEIMATPKAKVFPQTVTDLTRQKDFLRAGIAREEAVIGADGKPVMVGKGKRRRPKTRIVAEDAEGRVYDLHAMRTTLGTNLARAGVAPQIAQRIMRHADYRTTLKHYTVLGLTDTAKAISQLPSIQGPQRTLATGTDEGLTDPQQIPQQLQHETV